MTVQVEKRSSPAGDVEQRDRRVSLFRFAAAAVLVVAAAGLGIWAVLERDRAEDASQDLADAELRIDDLEAELAATTPSVPTGEGAAGQQFDSRWVAARRLPMIYGSLAAADETMVVVGLAPGRTPDHSVLAFYSDDGYEWEPARGMLEVVADDGTVGDEWAPGVGLSGVFGGQPVVAAGPQGFVAVVDDGGEAGWPVVAFSADGSSWEQIDLPANEVGLVFDVDVIAGPGGFVVHFDLIVEDSEGVPHVKPLVWFSDDGRNWVDTDLPRRGSVTVASDGSGWMAMSGEPDEGPARVFTSGDGLHWTEINAENPPPAEVLALEMESWGVAPFAVSDDTWLLIDRYGPAYPTAWVSTDNGTSWDEIVISNDPTFQQRTTRIGDIAVTNDGFLVSASQEDASTERDRNMVMFSEDATQWETHGAISDYVSMGVLGDDIVALDSDGTFYVWSGT